METPEFDLFKRIEDLEAKTESPFKLHDAFVIGWAALEFTYLTMCFETPMNPGKYKDIILEHLKKNGLNPKLLEGLEMN